MKKVLLGLLALVLLVVIGALVYWFTQDTRALRDQLTRYASETLGRTLAISGDITPSFSLTDGFSITVKGVSLANAKGFQPDTMLGLNELHLVVNPLALLHKRLEVKSLVLDTADVYLEQRGGQNNWTFGKAASVSDKTVVPSAAGTQAPTMQVSVDQVEVQNLTLTQITDGVKKVYTIEKAVLAAAPDKPVALDMKAVVDGAPLVLSLTAGTLAQIQGGEKQAIVVSLDFGSYEVRLQGDYRRSGETHHLTNATLAYNDVTATGDISLNMAGAVPDVMLDLSVPVLDVGAMQGSGSDASMPPEPKASDYATSSQVFSRAPLPWAQLKAANVNAKLDIKQLLNNGRNMGPADIQARLQSGVLVSTIIAQPPGATKPIIVKLNASVAQQVSIALSAPAMEPTLLMGDNPLIKAPANMMMELTGSGASMHAVMAGANGRFLLEFLPGTLNASALPLAAKGAIASIAGLDQIDGARLACTKVAFTIANGVATASGIGVDSAPLVAAGEGNINLGAETLALHLVAAPQVAVAKGARFPIYIKGNLASPTTTVDTAAITGQITNAVAGKAIKLIGNKDVASVADAFLGQSKNAAANDYAKMPFNPCRPNDEATPAADAVTEPAAAPNAPDVSSGVPQIDQIIRDPTQIMRDPTKLLKGFLGQ